MTEPLQQQMISKTCKILEDIYRYSTASVTKSIFFSLIRLFSFLDYQYNNNPTYIVYI